MKTFLFRLRLVGLVLTCATSCSSETMTCDEAAKWIAGYTPERINSNSTIRIELTDSVRHLYPDTPLDGILQFAPRVKGELRLTGKRMLEFVPHDGALKPGRKYTCRIQMAELTKLDSLGDFAFTFFVAERKTQLRIASVRVDPNDSRYMRAEGTLSFSEPVEASQVAAGLLHCDVQGYPARAAIEATDDPAHYRFTLSELKRPETETHVHVSFNADKLNFDLPAPQKIVIPGIREFKLLSAERHDAAQPYIEMEFSAPLSTEQELDGLIAIDRMERLRIERNGTNVKVFYDPNGLRELELRISDLVRDRNGQSLGHEVAYRFEQEVIPPAVEIPIHGTILPDGDDLTLPFRAVNLAAVDVEVVKIYADNVLSYLQDNEPDETYCLRRYGRPIYRRTVRLDRNESLNPHQWQNFSIDLKGLFRQERNAIYNVRLSFRKSYSLYDSAGAAPVGPQAGISEEEVAEWDTPCGYIDRKAPDYDWRQFDWSERDDPSKPSYYMCSERMPSCNLLASHLGMIVKRADGAHLWTTVSDIMTASPKTGIRVTAYNYQLHEIGSARTDAQGFADFDVTGTPFIVTATDGRAVSFLKVTGGKENSASRFDVGGRKNTQGIKGFVYGERGVWRPGDTVHLTLIAEHDRHALPSGHPVTLELQTPRGQLHYRQTIKQGQDGFYAFAIPTREEDPTGTYEARFKVGGQTFHHSVRIETIKPNRLKLNISSPEVLHAADCATIGIEAHWLTGPVAAGLQAKVEMTLFDNPHPFEGYGDYLFSNPLCPLPHARHEVLSGKLDSLGRIAESCRMPIPENAPGMMQANLIARITEPGGDESLTSRSVRYSPYDAYVGVALGDKCFETDCDLRFPVVAVDDCGRPLSGRELKYEIYRLNWSWWWEGSANDLSRYVQSTSAETVASGTLKSTEGKAEIPFRLEYPAWGKYLVLVRDTKSGHAAGGVVFIDWPDWRGHAGKSDPTAATMLSFSLDKRTYEAGDIATVYLPKTPNGRVLLSVENGSRVLSRRWVCTSAEKETAFRLPVTREMTPNFYVHATLLQPHAQTLNGQPIRMYGIQTAEVIDRRTILHPEIEVADEIRPQQEFTVKIRERDGKPMTYTLAIVDEGLLDITAFRTPDPWHAMNRREALGVRTWDLYDDVIGAYAGRFSSILSIGGDEALRQAAGKEKRFNPAVKFLGPFTLAKGAKTHRITLPMYVGSVRVMVVAAREGCYGHADKCVSVRSPLMVLPTLPRMLACGDRVKMPVNVFVMEQGITDVRVDVAVEGPLAVAGRRTRTLVFAGPSEQLADFELICDKAKNGRAKVTVTAAGGGREVHETIFIEVRNPLPPIVATERHLLQGGSSHSFVWSPFAEGKARLEAATLPVIDFTGAFPFVENYAHCCTEQLSSRAMYLLHARRFLPAKERQRAEKMLPGLLKAIGSRQLPSGGFAYWPGNDEAHDWVTSMAGQVLADAAKEGFAVPEQTMARWIDHQKAAAGKYRHTTEKAADLKQAYRLYTLVRAGEVQSGAMNRLREARHLSRQARLRLAAAYCAAGRNDTAIRLLEDLDASEEVPGDHTTFYSPLRDRALELETWLLAGRRERTMELSADIARQFSSTGSSTQEIAFVSCAMGQLAGTAPGASRRIRISQPGMRPEEIAGLRGAEAFEIQPAKGSVAIENLSEGDVHLALSTERTPSVAETIGATADGGTIEVRYTDLHDRPIAVQRLHQGDEFRAEIEIGKAAGSALSSSMALTFAIPSGWEIWNERLHGCGIRENCAHTEIRDDRICWYFPMKPGEKRRFSVRLRAVYAGRFVLPPAVYEDMYDNHCRANTPKTTVEVCK